MSSSIQATRRYRWGNIMLSYSHGTASEAERDRQGRVGSPINGLTLVGFHVFKDNMCSDPNDKEFGIWDNGLDPTSMCVCEESPYLHGIWDQEWASVMPRYQK